MYNIFPLNPELTKSQKKVLESDSDLIIYGPAGTGKTFLTILIAEKFNVDEYLLESKKAPIAKLALLFFDHS